MCRNIRTLYHFDPPTTDDEIRASALQFVRKVSGFTKPSAANQAAFDHAVDHVTATVRTLLAALVTTAPPRNREVEAAKLRARSARRFGPSPAPDAAGSPASPARPARPNGALTLQVTPR